jgi:hypothetical protein
LISFIFNNLQLKKTGFFEFLTAPQRAGWRRKETGEYFLIGMKNPPPPDAKPPVC